MEQDRPMLAEVVAKLLDDLKNGAGDRDKRRQVEDWMKVLSDKYPEFRIHEGLRDYYLAEAGRLREEFESSSDLAQRLAIGRGVEMFLDRAAEMSRRIEGEKSSS